MSCEYNYIISSVEKLEENLSVKFYALESEIKKISEENSELKRELEKVKKETSEILSHVKPKDNNDDWVGGCLGAIILGVII